MQTHLARSSDLQLKANTGYSASLSFFRCPMSPTSSWVNVRSPQYLIHQVKFTNTQPRNNIIKKTKRKNIKKNIKKRKTKNISILTPITNFLAPFFKQTMRDRNLHLSLVISFWYSQSKHWIYLAVDINNFNKVLWYFSRFYKSLIKSCTNQCTDWKR